MNPETGQLLGEGDTYKNVKLARTLRTIITYGGDVLYKGRLAAALARDIQEAGGIITEADLGNYRFVQFTPYQVSNNVRGWRRVKWVLPGEKT